MFESEQPQAVVECAQRFVIALIGVPQLGGDEQVVARQAGFGQGPSPAALVAVRGVDASVAGFERGGDRRRRFRFRDLEHPVPQSWHGDAVGEVDGGNAGHLLVGPFGVVCPGLADLVPASRAELARRKRRLGTRS